MADGPLLALIIPLGILAHELGHAAMALLLTDRRVCVLVGRQPGIVRVRIGRLALSLHLEPARGTGWRGLCVYQPTGQPRDALLIIAAGPFASLLWAIVCAAAFVLCGHQLHAMGLVALALGVVEGVVAFVYNGAAALMPSLMSARPQSDGAKFQQACRAQRGLQQIEQELGRPITRTELDQMIATRRRPSELLRGRRSVPPPSNQTRPNSRVSWTGGRNRRSAFPLASQSLPPSEQRAAELPSD